MASLTALRSVTGAWCVHVCVKNIVWGKKIQSDKVSHLPPLLPFPPPPCLSFCVCEDLAEIQRTLHACIPVSTSVSESVSMSVSVSDCIQGFGDSRVVAVGHTNIPKP